MDDKLSKLFTVDDVAEILYELFGDDCACNYNGIDEWLPMRCAYSQTECPNPKEHLGCWKQYLKSIYESSTGKEG